MSGNQNKEELKPETETDYLARLDSELETAIETYTTALRLLRESPGKYADLLEDEREESYEGSLNFVSSQEERDKHFRRHLIVTYLKKNVELKKSLLDGMELC